MKQLILLLITVTLWVPSLAQSSRGVQSEEQVIRGRVIDKESEVPLAGAAVMVLFGEKQSSGLCDTDGYYSLKVPIGRCDISVSYMGYEHQTIKNLMTYAGKETVLDFQMKPNVIEAQGVRIVIGPKKIGTIGDMATTSTRILSVEEANRYAGAWSDPARMASNLAGVASANDSRNDIVIRGNSPMGVQWRLDGFVIANPNHFGSMGGSGGNVGMINNNQLRNSDFYSGAFPAEYGDLTSGLFDLRLRNGNSAKREHMVALGFNGIELGAEGGFSKNSHASYLINARYSFLETLEMMGLNIAGTKGGVPKYWDVSAKLNFPMRNSNLSFILLPGQSKIKFHDDMEDKSEWVQGDVGEEVDMRNRQYFAGANYTYRFNDGSRLENRLSYQTFNSRTEVDAVEFMNTSRERHHISDFGEDRISYSGKYVNKINARNTINAGVSADMFITSLQKTGYVNGNQIKINDNKNEQTSLFGGFMQWQHKFNDKISILPGIHGQLYTLNGDFTIEPRLGFKWIANDKLTIGAATGLYSQSQPRVVYFYKENDQFMNKDLKMTRSWQSALSGEYMITPSLRFKTEVYYQYLYKVPVMAAIPEQSILNLGDDYNNQWDEVFTNQGDGYNYGIEFTLEKFFDKNFYLLVTASLYDSKYRGYDGVERDTKFNGNFALNVLGGYEFKVFKGTTMSVNAKVAWMGNKRYTPASSVAGSMDLAYDYSKINTLKMPDYFRVDININLKTDFKGVSVEYFFEADNLTNHKNVWRQHYNPTQNKNKYTYQQEFTPMGGVRVYF